MKAFGVEEHQVPLDTFNAFMVVDIDSDSHYTFRAPVIAKGDYIEFRAEIDQLVAISACPATSEINDYEPKALRVEIRPA